MSILSDTMLIFQPISFRQTIKSIVLLSTTILFSCASVYDFKIEQSYVMDQFSGKDLAGASIVAAPILGKLGRDTVGELSPVKFTVNLRKLRPDLELISFKDFEKAFAAFHDTATLNDFYRLLFDGNIVELQNADSLWASVNGRYLLALRLRDGKTIRSFERSTRKRITLEGELWDKDSSETVWRVTVYGFCESEKITDSRFLFEAVSRIYKALPVTIRSNEDGKW